MPGSLSRYVHTSIDGTWPSAPHLVFIKIFLSDQQTLVLSFSPSSGKEDTGIR